MNPVLLLEEAPVLAPVVGALSAVTCPACAGMLTGVAVSAAAASAALAMFGLGVGHTLALVLLARLVRPFTIGIRHLHTAQRGAGIALVAVGLFFAWQATGTGITIGPTLPWPPSPVRVPDRRRPRHSSRPSTASSP